MKLVKELTQHFPYLSQIDLDSLFDGVGEELNPRCIIAKRAGAYSLAVYIATNKVSELFTALGVSSGVPTVLADTILTKSPRILIDVDSILTEQLRFYVYHKDYASTGEDLAALEQSYPFNTTPVPYTQTVGLGFFMENSALGQVVQYKYYFNKDHGNSNSLTNFRFDAEGTLITSFDETGTFNPDSTLTQEFTQFLTTLDLTGHGLSHVTRDDGSNSYIVINQMVNGDLTAFPFGGSSDLVDLSQVPPPPEH